MSCYNWCNTKSIKTKVITVAIHRASRQKLYDELRLHSLSKRRWRSKLIFHKKLNGLLQKYLYLLLTSPSQGNKL